MGFGLVRLIVGARTKSSSVRIAMDESGLAYICVCCCVMSGGAGLSSSGVSQLDAE